MIQYALVEKTSMAKSEENYYICLPWRYNSMKTNSIWIYEQLYKLYRGLMGNVFFQVGLNSFYFDKFI